MTKHLSDLSFLSLLLALSVLALIAVQMVSSDAAAADAATELDIATPYARAVPAGTPHSAAFMSITNQGTADRALVAATSPVAEAVELHTHQRDAGIMRMRQVERIELPARTTVALAPGGLHLMLIGLSGALEADTTLPLTLTLDDGSQLELSVPVAAPVTGGSSPSAQ